MAADRAQPDLGRGDWVSLGAKILRQEGPSALTVDRLTRGEGRSEEALRVHFRGIGALILAVAQHWSDSEGRIIAQCAGAPGTSLERLWAVLALTGADDPQLERGVRALAADYLEIGDLVRVADDRREQVLTGLIAESYGLDGVEATHYARLFQALHIATLGRAPGEIVSYVSGPVRALTALLDSNFPTG